ncbi:MAG TPA: methyltransferase [Sphingomonadales bacterium]|nr:methyltransferase [Sphingomonadales bacterium]
MIKTIKNPLMFAFTTSFLLFSAAANSIASETVADHRMSAQATTKLERILTDGHRSDGHMARDKYRHPRETLKFIGVEPHMTVVEIWPGGQGGWYREILEPFLKDKGKYIPVGSKSDFPEKVDNVPYGKVDMVMVFRAHGFIIYDAPALDHVKAIYAMLKPGGILSIVDHAGDESIPQSADPKGKNGYVNESHFRGIAEKAGFKFLAESDINRNPADSKKHPRGVWSLPPTLSGSLPFTDKRAEFLKIGESDRFTLKFYKPE